MRQWWKRFIACLLTIHSALSRVKYEIWAQNLALVRIRSDGAVDRRGDFAHLARPRLRLEFVYVWYKPAMLVND